MSLLDSFIVNEITVSLDTQTEELVDEPTSAEFVQSYIHIVDAVLITVIAWVVVVIVSLCGFFTIYPLLSLSHISILLSRKTYHPKSISR